MSYEELKNSLGIEDESKNCPYCSEKIKKGAIKCKHCGEWLNERKERYNEKDEPIMQKVIPISIKILLGVLLVLYVIGFFEITASPEKVIGLLEGKKDTLITEECNKFKKDFAYDKSEKGIILGVLSDKEKDYERLQNLAGICFDSLGLLKTDEIKRYVSFKGRFHFDTSYFDKFNKKGEVEDFIIINKFIKINNGDKYYTLYDIYEEGYDFHIVNDKRNIIIGINSSISDSLGNKLSNEVSLKFFEDFTKEGHKERNILTDNYDSEIKTIKGIDFFIVGYDILEKGGKRSLYHSIINFVSGGHHYTFYIGGENRKEVQSELVNFIERIKIN